MSPQRYWRLDAPVYVTQGIIVHDTFQHDLRPSLLLKSASCGLWNLVPANLAIGPSSSSMRSSWLYLARRSPRHGAPALSWPLPSPTARSAMNVSSVSPLRWDTCTPQPASCAVRHASIASDTVPIWFTYARTDQITYIVSNTQISSFRKSPKLFERVLKFLLQNTAGQTNGDYKLNRDLLKTKNHDSISAD